MANEKDDSREFRRLSIIHELKGIIYFTEDVLEDLEREDPSKVKTLYDVVETLRRLHAEMSRVSVVPASSSVHSIRYKVNRLSLTLKTNKKIKKGLQTIEKNLGKIIELLTPWDMDSAGSDFVKSFELINEDLSFALEVESQAISLIRLNSNALFDLMIDLMMRHFDTIRNEGDFMLKAEKALFIISDRLIRYMQRNHEGWAKYVRARDSEREIYFSITVRFREGDIQDYRELRVKASELTLQEEFLEIEIDVPEDTETEEIERLTKQAVLGLDNLHRSHGGRGLRVSDLQVTGVKVPEPKEA